MKLRKFVGAAVRDMRLGQDLTQEELANRSGLHRTYITDVERGNRNISIESIEKIAGALRTPLSALFARSEELQGDDGGRSVRLMHHRSDRVDASVEILIAEEDRSFIDMTVHTFKNANVRNTVHTVHDGGEVLSFVHATGPYEKRASFPPPSLIIMDQHIPRGGALEVLERLRAHPSSREIPVIILTSSQSEANSLRKSGFAFVECVTKPVSVTDIGRVASAFGMQLMLVNGSTSIAVSSEGR